MTKDPVAAAPEKPPVLELENVDVPAPGDADTAVLRSVDWRVAEGDAWLVTGPPGGGKTSVLTVAAGLVRPTRGRQKIFGADLQGLTETEQVERRSRVGFVFGGGGRLFAQLTVLENLMLPLRYHGRTMSGPGGGGVEAVAAMVEKLELEPHAAQFPRELPRRVAQRVALARALVLQPEVLLLDDPSAGMEAADQEWWVEYVCRVREAGGPRTVVVACTDARPWAGLAAHRAVVRAGRWEIRHPHGDHGAGLRPAPGA